MKLCMTSSTRSQPVLRTRDRRTYSVYPPGGLQLHLGAVDDLAEVVEGVGNLVGLARSSSFTELGASREAGESAIAEPVSIKLHGRMETG